MTAWNADCDKIRFLNWGRGPSLVPSPRAPPSEKRERVGSGDETKGGRPGNHSRARTYRIF